MLENLIISTLIVKMAATISGVVEFLKKAIPPLAKKWDKIASNIKIYIILVIGAGVGYVYHSQGVDGSLVSMILKGIIAGAYAAGGYGIVSTWFKNMGKA